MREPFDDTGANGKLNTESESGAEVVGASSLRYFLGRGDTIAVERLLWCTGMAPDLTSIQGRDPSFISHVVLAHYIMVMAPASGGLSRTTDKCLRRGDT